MTYLIPQTDLERAFVQAGRWTLRKIERRAKVHCACGEVHVAAGYFVALAYRALIEDQNSDISSLEQQIMSVFPQLSKLQQLSLVRLLVHLIRNLAEDCGMERAFVLPIVLCATAAIENCERSIDLAFLSLQLGRIAKPKSESVAGGLAIPQELHSFLAHWHELIAGKNLDAAEETLSEIMARAKPLGLNWTVKFLAKHLPPYKSEQGEIEVDLLFDELCRLLECEPGKSLPLEVCAEVQNIAAECESANRMHEAAQLYLAIIDSVIHSPDQDLLAQILRGLVTSCLATDRFADVAQACMAIKDACARGALNTQLELFRVMHQKQCETITAAEQRFHLEKAKEEPNQGLVFRSLVELAVANLKVGRAHHKRMYKKIASLVMHAPANELSHYLLTIYSALPSDEFTPAILEALVYPLLRRSARAKDQQPFQQFVSLLETKLARYRSLMNSLKEQTNEIELRAYLTAAQARIRRAWFPPKREDFTRIVVALTVRKGGKLSDVRIEQSAGVSVADEAALRAAHKLDRGGLEPLPVSPYEVELYITFDYNPRPSPGKGLHDVSVTSRRIGRSYD